MQKFSDSRKAVIYARYSSHSQRDVSIDQQIRACRAFAEDFEPAVIKKWLRTFYWRFFTQQFKRNCMPDGVKVGTVGLGPRGDWNMPSDAAGRIWLEEVDSL